MVISHVVGLLAHPKHEWETIRDANESVGRVFATVLILAAIPVVSGFFGTTQVGWQIGTSAVVKLTIPSAVVMAVLYYLVILAAIFSMGWMIHWMGQTYGTHRPLSQCVILAAYIPTPLFLAGVTQLFPVLWLNLLVGLPCVAYTVFLLYTGIPIMMGISEERGFLFASAVAAVGMVGLVGMLAATVILWSQGFGPEFTTSGYTG